MEIFRDYIYFQDSIYDSDEVEIVCRYPQFFAAKLLKQSIVNSVVTRSGKGGTYFGATGCGKTYTMAFLARQLALRCTDIPEIGSPTIILIVDRDELQKQGSKLFTKSKEFLNLGEVSVVKNRTQLRQELGARQSGGFYICTIQKFCDREDDKIGLINDRQNIICFSDEAHRTQLEHSKKIQFSKDADENMKAMVSKPYAKVLKEAFPHATFVGFTGTPIAETYQTFGDEIDRYTMDQAVADGLTVSIKYHPRIAKVLLDNKKVKEIENYYKKCVDDGATYEDIEASKKAMSSMEIILGEPSRLERLATDIHNHYVASCTGDPDRIQKAMVVCSNRKIAYALLQKFKDKYPEWFEEKKSPDGVSVTEEEMEGITKGLAGVDNIELLQIQEFSAWRAIRFQHDVATPFPIQRGTVIPLDKDTFLIWTHGSVQHDELAGKNLNYYKNGRGIPASLLVKRFMGKSSALELVNEILMLTKMNWNSGDGLYKILPVTLDFAKVLSRVAKQDLVVYDRPYNFRYFM